MPPRRLRVGSTLRQCKGRRVSRHDASRQCLTCARIRELSHAAKRAMCPPHQHYEVTSALSHMGARAASSTRSHHLDVRRKSPRQPSARSSEPGGSCGVARSEPRADLVVSTSWWRSTTQAPGRSPHETCGPLPTAWPCPRQKFRRMWYAAQHLGFNAEQPFVRPRPVCTALPRAIRQSPSAQLHL